MCTAVYKSRMLGRTVDRVGSAAEHRIIGRRGYAGGAVECGSDVVWIDGINRSGLMAALLNYEDDGTVNFRPNADIIDPGMLVPRILEYCTDTDEAMRFLCGVRLSAQHHIMNPHYIIADKMGRCAVYESGRIYRCAGVLTNAPSYPRQMRKRSRRIGFAGDVSSEARFRRMTRLRSRCPVSSDMDMFGILAPVCVPSGADDRAGYRTILRTVMSAENMTYSWAQGCSGSIRSIEVGEVCERTVCESDN